MVFYVFIRNLYHTLNKCLEWVLGQTVKMPTVHFQMPGFDYWLLIPVSFQCRPWEEMGISWRTEFLHPLGRHGLHSSSRVQLWPIPSCCYWSLQNEHTDGNVLFIYLCILASQTNNLHINSRDI